MQSSVWQFAVPSVSAVRDTSSGFYTDINGDGFGDVVVSEDVFTVAAYTGSARGLSVAPSQRLHLDFALNLARIGDVNGDGFSDYIVSPAGGTPSPEMAGPKVLYGSLTGLQDPGVRVMGLVRGSSLGVRAQPLGDLNGDGYTDFAAGLNHDSTPDTWLGDIVYVIGGAPNGEVPRIIASVPRRMTGDNPLYDVDILAPGDVDGDGTGDLIVLSSVSDIVQPPLRYSANVFHGSIPLGAPIAQIGTESEPYLGLFRGTYGVRHSPCDTDGDGLADVVALVRQGKEFHLGVFRGANLARQWPIEVDPHPLSHSIAPFVSCGASIDGVHFSAVAVLGDTFEVGVWDGPASSWTDLSGTYRRAFPDDVEPGLAHTHSLSIGADVDGDHRSDVYIYQRPA